MIGAVALLLAAACYALTGAIEIVVAARHSRFEAAGVLHVPN